MTEVAVDYLELGLRLGRHIDGLVDAYYGPAEIAERVDAEEPRDPGSLDEDAARLRDSLDGWKTIGALARRAARRLATAARKLGGEEISFEDEVERCYGVRPRLHAGVRVRGRAQGDRRGAARERLARRALPALARGRGDSGRRDRRGRLDGSRTSSRAVRPKLFGLPEGESVDFDYVTDEPWTAYNYYRGDLRSRIAVNTDMPMTPDVVVELVAHETYPGHHTEHSWKEQLLTRAGRLEETIVLIPTPQSVVSEGIASSAADIVLGEERYDVTASNVSDTGVHYDAELSSGS